MLSPQRSNGNTPPEVAKGLKCRTQNTLASSTSERPKSISPLWERARVRGIGAVKASFTLTPPLSPHRERAPIVKILLAFVLV